MAKPSTHINYSFEDIQRYLTGIMSAAEMHNIEKAALQDPFLADAMEGYNLVDAAAAQQHLNEINTNLLKEKNKSKIVQLNKKTKWLNIAAAVIVLAGIGLIGSYFFRYSNKTLNVAQVKNEPVKNNAAKDSIINDNVITLSKKPDTTLLVTENKTKQKTAPLATTKESFHKNAIVNKPLKKVGKVSTSVGIAPAPVQINTYNAAPITDTTASTINTAKVSNESVALKDKVFGLSHLPATFTGKVVDETNKPIAGVTIESADKKDLVITNLNGDFSLQNNDTVLNIVAHSAGYYNNTATLQFGRINAIVLKQTNENLNDEVADGYGVTKKDKISSDSAMPVGGWNNFNHYVIAQLNIDTTNRDEFYKNHMVELEFLIDDYGNPYNIRVVKSLCDKRNSEAINILKTGPRWTSQQKNKKARVNIPINP